MGKLCDEIAIKIVQVRTRLVESKSQSLINSYLLLLLIIILFIYYFIILLFILYYIMYCYISFIIIIIIIIYVCMVLCLDVECKNVNGCRLRRRKTPCKPRKHLSV